MIKITMNTERFEKVGSKWVIDIKESEQRTITEECYINMINSKGFFRNLGGYERHDKTYTCYGYKVNKITAISPNKENKSVYSYKFEY